MAHSKSAKKNIRQNEEVRLHNRSMKSALRTEIKKLAVALKSGDMEKAKEAFKGVQKRIDKTASKRIIPKGRASRVKARLSVRVRALKPAAAAK